MSNTSIIKDYYPNETKSFKNLPKECPIQYLSYGGILTNICDKVKTIRKKKRSERQKFLIQKILNVNIHYLINDIQEEAREKGYKAREWTKGGSSKRHFLQFFTKNDISLKYLEDAYTNQLVGPPKIKVGDFISLKNSYWGNHGIVSNITKSYVYYIRCGVKLVNHEELPDFGKYYYPSWGKPDTYQYKISIWKCDKVGEDTEELKNRRKSDMWNKGIEYRKRKEFWENNSVFDDVRMPFDYYDYSFNLFNVEIPKYYTAPGVFPAYPTPEVWILIRDTIILTDTNK